MWAAPGVTGSRWPLLLSWRSPKAAPRQEAYGPPAPLLQLYQAPEAPERGFL